MNQETEAAVKILKHCLRGDLSIPAKQRLAIDKALEWNPRLQSGSRKVRVREAARMLCCSTRTVRRMVDRGQLQPTRINDHLAVWEDAVADHLARKVEIGPNPLPRRPASSP